ncbi:alternative ribosome rescue aminoacyl-tRNA hydrolase ArfB [Vibrio sonorensis]|uniref:alternative ribosome rescue aminoacyl-tRNA hydrolase ArfB n=1 Tax=Vibrio sonorensis TaxID=1004316 RepID=UPI0008DA93F8|nr:alternative ribosome rescue aminoacyl-tRNA hydrolase ArfB [Vibrio sonorensis]
MLKISNKVAIPDHEIEMTAVRAMGSGGQKVNKTSSAVHLKFDVPKSSLPEFYKEKLLRLNDSRVSKDGVIVIKSQSYRSQQMNRDDALLRLQQMIASVNVVQKARRATKPTKNSQKRRVDNKKKKGQVKSLRQKVV